MYAIRSNTGSHHFHEGFSYNNVAWHLIEDNALTPEMLANDNLDIMSVTGIDDPQLAGHAIFGHVVIKAKMPVRPAGLSAPKTEPRISSGKPDKPKAPPKPDASAKPEEIKDRYSEMDGKQLRAVAKSLDCGDFPAVGVKNAEILAAIRKAVAAGVVPKTEGDGTTE